MITCYDSRKLKFENLELKVLGLDSKNDKGKNDEYEIFLFLCHKRVITHVFVHKLYEILFNVNFYTSEDL